MTDAQPGPAPERQWDDSSAPAAGGFPPAAAQPGPAAPVSGQPAAYPGAAASQAQAGPPAQVAPQVPAVPQIPAQRPSAAEPAHPVPAVVQPWQQEPSAPAARPAAQPSAQPWTAAAGTATAATTATTTAATTGAATTPTAAPATVGPDGPRPPGTVQQSRHALRQARRRALSRRLTPLHAGWHLVTIEALRQLNGASPGSGLILGVDQQRRPILVRFFRPEATKVTLVGGVWAQRLLAFRALALGARIVLITTDPGAWQGFGELATGRSDRVALWDDPRPPVVPATAEQPALIIHDTGAYGATPLPDPRPWQTQLVVLRQLGVDNARALQDCDLLITQRLGAAEASVAVPALGLPEQSAQLLQLMGEDMLALLDGGADRYVWLSLTAIEHQYNGTPHR